MHETLWKACLGRLEHELPEQQLNLWIRPLQAAQETDKLLLLAPNRYILDWVRDNHLNRIQELVEQLSNGSALAVSLEVGSTRSTTSAPVRMEKPRARRR